MKNQVFDGERGGHGIHNFHEELTVRPNGCSVGLGPKKTSKLNFSEVCNGNDTHQDCWLVVWNMNGLWLPIYWEFHNPNWRTHIFQRGIPPTRLARVYHSMFRFFHPTMSSTALCWANDFGEMPRIHFLLEARKLMKADSWNTAERLISKGCRSKLTQKITITSTRGERCERKSLWRPWRWFKQRGDLGEPCWADKLMVQRGSRAQ